MAVANPLSCASWHGTHAGSVVSAYFQMPGAQGSSTVMVPADHDIHGFEARFKIRTHRHHKNKEGIFPGWSDAHFGPCTYQEGPYVK